MQRAFGVKIKPEEVGALLDYFDAVSDKYIQKKLLCG